MRQDEFIHEKPPRFFGVSPELEQLVLKDRALDEAAEGITIADATQADRPLIYVNKGFERLTGYSASEALGRNCRFLQGANTDPVTVAKIRNAVEAGTECVVELLNYHKNGRSFWNRLSITPVKDDTGNVTHFIGIQSDITARKNVEEALNKTNTRLDEANRRISEDIEMAAQIQRGFLPQEPLRIDGVEFAWDLRPCDELAGDTINVVPLDSRNVEFYAIDVSGHGVPAALLSVTLNHLLLPAGGRLVLGPSTPDGSALSPVDVVQTLNRQFPYDHERNQYFTLAYGVYDTETRDFRFVSAGHPPLIHVTRTGETRHDWVEGIPVGIQSDFKYALNTIQLSPGDRIYLYSDGLLEVFDPGQAPYGLERLEQTLRNTRQQTLKESISSVFGDLERWGRRTTFDDDVSILAFEVR